MTKDLSAFMNGAVEYPDSECIHAAQEVADKLRPFYESANFSALQTAAQIAAKMVPIGANNNPLWETVQSLNRLSEKFATSLSLLAQHMSPTATAEQLAYIQSLADLYRPKEELAQAYIASLRLFQQLTGEAWQTPPLGKAHRIQRIFENLDQLGIELNDYDSVPIKDFIDALIDREADEYESTLKKRFPSVNTSTSTSPNDYSLRKEIYALLIILTILKMLNDATSTWANLVTIGVLPQSPSITELFDDPEPKLEKSIEQHQKPKCTDEQLSNPRPRCGCDSKTCRDQNDEETPPTHEPTSTLI